MLEHVHQPRVASGGIVCQRGDRVARRRDAAQHEARAACTAPGAWRVTLQPTQAEAAEERGVPHRLSSHPLDLAARRRHEALEAESFERDQLCPVLRRRQRQQPSHGAQRTDEVPIGHAHLHRRAHADDGVLLAQRVRHGRQAPGEHRAAGVDVVVVRATQCFTAHLNAN